MKYIVAALSCALFALPAVVFAASVTVTPPYPGSTVVAGTRVSFSVLTSGFDTPPSFWVVDSFGGGANNSNLSGGGFFWTPNINQIGAHTITITATDAFGTTSNAMQQITVLAQPTITVANATSSTTVGYPLAFVITAVGLYSPAYSVADSFGNSSVRASAVDYTGTLRWTPLPQDVGAHTLSITATDSFNVSTTTTLTVTVLPIDGSTPLPNAATSTVAASPVAVAPVTPVPQPPTPTSAVAAYVFTKFLTQGSSGAEVMALQQALAKWGYLGVAPTGYFGALTKAAVAKFQTAHGIASVGYVGPGTRAQLNKGN